MFEDNIAVLNFLFGCVYGSIFLRASSFFFKHSVTEIKLDLKKWIYFFLSLSLSLSFSLRLLFTLANCSATPSVSPIMIDVFRQALYLGIQQVPLLDFSQPVQSYVLSLYQTDCSCGQR